ncbi:MAG: biotin--[acetyl-CoA-carboxylase] ligase [Betaproteobacteria bacterium]|nr:biotin--[acetyl-CoA-carboxylase] ligase [Betaproteobacteria bacterium]
MPAVAADDAARALELQRALERAGHACAVGWVAETGSTNTDLLAQVRAGGSGARCLVAGHQSAGRGRRSRSWHDDAQGALLCSLAWPLARGTQLTGLSLAVGVWLLQALDDIGVREAALKWPNDVLLQARKLAGVLVEVADAADARWVVIGVGLNLVSPPAVPQAIGLDAQGLRIDRWDMLHALLPRMLAGLVRFARQGFAPWVDAWNQAHAWNRCTVQVLSDGVPVQQGLALGVDAQGFLWLQTPGGRERVASGDVSLRAPSD